MLQAVVGVTNVYDEGFVQRAVSKRGIKIFDIRNHIRWTIGDTFYPWISCFCSFHSSHLSCSAIDTISIKRVQRVQRVQCVHIDVHQGVGYWQLQLDSQDASSCCFTLCAKIKQSKKKPLIIGINCSSTLAVWERLCMYDKRITPCAELKGDGGDYEVQYIHCKHYP